MVVISVTIKAEEISCTLHDLVDKVNMLPLYCFMHAQGGYWYVVASYHVWQSHVEIEEIFCLVFRSHHCVWIAVPLNIWGQGHTCFVDVGISSKSTKCIWALPLMEVQWYAASNTAMLLNIRRNKLRFHHGTATCIDVQSQEWEIGLFPKNHLTHACMTTLNVY